MEIQRSERDFDDDETDSSEEEEEDEEERRIADVKEVMQSREGGL